jgi:hypothetical protein
MTNLIDIFKRRLLINSVFEGLFNSKKDLNILLTDGTDPITPVNVTVVGNDVEVEVASSGAAPSGRELMKTGQTTSYRTGDDGDLQEGRDVDFFTLDYTNPFGNTNRFTDELGGQDYTDDIVIDWSTYNAVTGKVLGVYRIRFGNNNINVDDLIDACVAHSIGIYTSGWRLWNAKEAENFIRRQINIRPFNYFPLSISENIEFFTSTPELRANFVITIDNLQRLSSQQRTVLRQGLAVRTFTVTGTTLT